MRIRPATPADAEALADTVTGAFEGYRDIAPPGWEPPSRADELTWLRDNLGRPDVWCELGEDGGEMAGHVAFQPSERSRAGDGDPALAHFWQLFVRPPWWGTGLASELNRRAAAAAAARGFTVMRLYTPAAQLRARRFYEREGWTVHGATESSPFGLDLIQYRRDL